MKRARWHLHVNAVNPPQLMRNWLTDRISLTIKLMASCTNFRVQRLHQQRGLCLGDEMAQIGLPRRVCVREREVLLRCDERPMVFAHTVMPLTATANDWPFFSALGDRSLGTTLFGDPRVVRGSLQYARLPVGHPLAQRACKTAGFIQFDGVLYARRCLFRRKNGLLLVTEVFVPAIAELSPANVAQEFSGDRGKRYDTALADIARTDGI